MEIVLRLDALEAVRRRVPALSACRTLPAISLPDSRQEVDLLAFDAIFEQSESCLLAGVEHLIEVHLCLADLGSRPGFDLVERLELIFDERVVDSLAAIRGLHQPSKFLKHAVPLVLSATARLLERTQPDDERRVLVVPELQFLLRLHRHERVEELVEFLW